ncbi:alpha/beta fold hydrolase [Streptomyces boncukensis]|uniref:Alpha/beta hydrolase n=1 Tax=Streptomyces boncukensis TaxID=2711219 RepID=A0A6G4WRJ2_9ACTN|nr:alpha/beta hydrolase [Streptomyces boncukensis]NGO67718.1 alpha/beta hydrolase [Streptomyces boncukensis]
MARVMANGVDHHVQRLPAAGAGPHGADPPAVVLVHGAFIDSLASYYFTLGPEFAAAGCDAVMYDLRGHGRSARPERGYTVADFTADLAALLDALRLPGPVHLVGNSFGGTVALDFAVHHPERVAGLTVVESGPATREWAATMAAALRTATETLPEEEALNWFVEQYGTVSSTRRGDPRHDAHVRRLGRAAARLIRTTGIAREIHTGRALTDAQLAALRCPVLLINGQDGLVGAESDRLSALLPDCRVAVVPGHKHSVLVEAADQVSELALHFIAAAPRGTPSPDSAEGDPK